VVQEALMIRAGKTLVALALVLAVGACESRTDKTDGGGVILSIEDFDGLPFLVSVNGTLVVQVEEITVANVAKNSTAPTSTLMNVEIHSYEITFTRGDDGTRLPVAFVRGMFGVAPVNGTFVLENAPILGFDQLTNPPLSDLLFENGGVDTETGRPRITLNLRLRFFGRTLSGDEVQTAPAPFTIDFVP
jgi:hypothetical protein